LHISNLSDASVVLDSPLPARPSARLTVHGDRPVIITMIPMWMMQVAVDQVVKVIAVGNALMCTARAMYMSLVMCAAVVIRRTSLWIRGAHVNNVFVNVVEVCVL
jgi:hypothetical protein